MRRFFGGRGSAKFKKNDLVKLEEGAPYAHLLPGTIGVVAEAYGGESPSYEIEFIDASGATLDRLVVKEVHLSRIDDA